ncbi:MAG: diguanylate cyclase [Planctomycetes bacterium]|nr:diguanylate cyclase [Planctomycetota bacterium]
MNGSKTPAKVVVVDDDPLSVEFLALHLASAGFEALVARDAHEALDLVRAGKSRTVIADWLMPEMDGLELCKAIRSLKNLNYVYFIMLTMVQGRHRLIEAFEAGVDDFISKPVQPEELLARLQVGMRMIGIQERLKQNARSVARLNKELAAANKRLQRLSATDDLTGLPNRRYAMLRLQEEWSLAERSGQPFACALVDVDAFKDANDTHGHPFGDAVLRQIGAVLRSSVRAGDVTCRFGGDEFLIIFRNQDAQGAGVGAERCRLVVQKQAAQPSKDLRSPITISIGVAQKEPDMSGPDDLLQSADKALYAAKHSGKNSVWAWDAAGPYPAATPSHLQPLGEPPCPAALLCPSPVGERRVTSE